MNVLEQRITYGLAPGRWILSSTVSSMAVVARMEWMTRSPYGGTPIQRMREIAGDDEFVVRTTGT